MKMKKWSSQWTQFVQLRKEAWKKIRTSTGFEPVTSQYRCDALLTELWSHRISESLWRKKEIPKSLTFFNLFLFFYFINILLYHTQKKQKNNTKQINKWKKERKKEKIRKRERNNAWCKKVKKSGVTCFKHCWLTTYIYHRLAWVSGLPTGLGEKRFHFSPFPQKRLILRLTIDWKRIGKQLFSF